MLTCLPAFAHVEPATRVDFQVQQFGQLVLQQLDVSGRRLMPPVKSNRLSGCNRFGMSTVLDCCHYGTGPTQPHALTARHGVPPMRRLLDGITGGRIASTVQRPDAAVMDPVENLGLPGLGPHHRVTGERDSLAIAVHVGRFEDFVFLLGVAHRAGVLGDRDVQPNVGVDFGRRPVGDPVGGSTEPSGVQGRSPGRLGAQVHGAVDLRPVDGCARWRVEPAKLSSIQRRRLCHSR